MSKKRLMLFIILALISIFIICTFRKFFIINKIQSNLIEKSNYTNYYFKQIDKVGIINNNNYTIYRRLGEKRIIEKNNGLYSAQFSDSNIYFFDNENKKYLKSDSVFTQNFDEHFLCYIFGENANSLLEQFKIALTSKINNIDYNEKNCYEIITLQESNKYVHYIDKENLLQIADGVIEHNKDNIQIYTEYEIQFDNQMEENFNKEKILEGYTQLN